MKRVSVIDALSSALERTTAILFSPFDIGQWLTLGFAAWLAALAEAGVPAMTFQFPFDRLAPGPEASAQLPDMAHRLLPALAAIGVLVIAVIVIVSMATGIALLWVSSRGRFVFLHHVASRTTEIVRPWSRFACHGNSLFAWHLVFGLMIAVLALAVLLTCALLAVPSAMAGRLLPLTVAAVACGVTTLLAAGAASACIELFLKDFIVPVMYALDLRAPAAWDVFGGLLKAHPGAFARYVLTRMLLGVSVFMVLGGVLFFTCCCCGLGLLLAVPYVSAVLLLPVSVFFRCFGMEFLAQCDPACSGFDRHEQYAAPRPPPLPQTVA